MWDDNSVGDPQVSSKPAPCSGYSSLSLVCTCLFPPLYCFLSGNSQPPKTVLLWTLLSLPSSSLQTCASVYCFRWQLWADSSILPSLLGFCPTPTFTSFPVWLHTHFHSIPPLGIFFFSIYKMHGTRFNCLSQSSGNEWCKGGHGGSAFCSTVIM